MESLRQILPSLNPLTVFECAGRLESFSAAARELHMTQAAVSYAIAKLEDQLGTALFLREYRRVRLSEAGQRFHADVTIGLSHIQRAAQGLRATASGTHVSLACSTAFAAYWMVPRMERFRTDLPGVDLRIHSADRDLDLMGEGIALGIRGDMPEDWPQYDGEALAPEEIYPVCAQSYLDRNPMPDTAEELTTHTLIHLDEPFRSATTWAQWFSALGVPSRHLPRGLQINDYVLVLQSVLAGQGVALGWHHLVEGMVQQGALVPLTEHTLSTGKAFHVIWPKQIPLSRPAALVRDWLVAQRAA